LTWDTETDGALRVSDPASGLGYVFHTPQAIDDGEAVDLPLQAIVDRNGQRITVQYADDGAPTRVTHSGGYRIALDRHATLPRISAIRLLDTEHPHNRGTTLLSYGYNDHGHLAEVINSSGLPTRFTYDDAGRITSWTDRNDSSYTYLYDERGRVVRTEGSGGFLSGSLAYDDATRTTTVTDSLGHTTRYEHNEAFRLVRETDPLGHTTSHEWDAAHHLTAVTDALGNTNRYRYDQSGQLTSVVRADGSETHVEYNDLGLPTTVTGPEGVIWHYAYDERGNRTAITDAATATTHFSYNKSGHLTSITDPFGHSTCIRCDRAGLPVATTDPLGAETRYERNAFGRPATLTDPLGNETRFEWTLEGKLARRTAADGSTESWTYDGEGNCTSHTDAMGAVHRFEYTHFDLLSARTGPDGVRHSFTHDSELRLTKVTNPQGLNWSYQFDAAGRLVSEVDFDNRVLGYSYDPVGRLTARTNALGQDIHFERDVLGQIIRQTDGDKVTTFAYMANGELAMAITPDATVNREHDAAGRLLSETVNGRTVTYRYDPMGRRTLRTTPTGMTSTWRYDEAGNCIERTSADHTITFDRDPVGRELSRHFDGTLTLANAFDELGRLTAQSVTERTAGHNLQQRAYSYRADGRLTGIDDQLNGTSRFDLDTAGRVTTVHAAGWTERYAYDEAGNQTDASWPATHPGHEATGPRTYTGTSLTRAGNVRYEHDAAGRITLRQKTRLSRKRDTWRYTWDTEDRLVSVITPDGVCWRYLYDALGRRVAKQRLAGDNETVVEQTDFTWDGATLCEQTTSTPDSPNPVTLTWDHEGLHPIAQTERVTAPDAPQQEIDSRFFAIVTDLVGTPTELVDETGDIAWRTRSTLWGTTSWGSDSTAHTPLRFPGQYDDPETGLHYNYFRYYDPESARYLTPDPLGLAPAPNPVAYVTNPHAWTDPLGLSPCKTGSAEPFGPDPYAGTKEASKLLREAGVPRAFRIQVMQSFEDGTLSVRRAGDSDYGMRFYDNENAWARGRYLTTQWPATREEIAVKASWNQFSFLKQWKIRPGAPIIEGRVGPQGVGYPGGGKQTYVLNPDRDLLEP
jgi:RHS repeat-associated protein